MLLSISGGYLEQPTAQYSSLLPYTRAFSVYFEESGARSVPISALVRPYSERSGIKPSSRFPSFLPLLAEGGLSPGN